MGDLRASELRDIETAIAELPEAARTIDTVLKRIRPHCELVRPGARVLEVGAAQGMYVVALKRAGYDAAGVEPWRPAIETGHELAARSGVEFELIEGVGENLPFEDQEFDFVLSISVMEHVRDPLAVFREVHRVLTPGGGFYFHTTSALSRKQEEIKGFPLFAWYPAPVQRRIMAWAAANRPLWVGGTRTPAVNWFTPWGVRRDLRAVGFARALERWDLVRDDELSGWGRRAVRLARANGAARFAAEFVKPGSGYLAVK